MAKISTVSRNSHHPIEIFCRYVRRCKSGTPTDLTTHLKKPKTLGRYWMVLILEKALYKWTTE